MPAFRQTHLKWERFSVLQWTWKILAFEGVTANFWFDKVLSVCCFEFLSSPAKNIYLLCSFHWWCFCVFLLGFEAFSFVDLDFCSHKCMYLDSIWVWVFFISLKMTTFVVYICLKNERACEMQAYELVTLHPIPQDKCVLHLNFVFVCMCLKFCFHLAMQLICLYFPEAFLKFMLHSTKEGY